YQPGRINWFDPVSGIEHRLATVPSGFNPPANGEVSHVDITRDLNNDGLDDLVVPDLDGFWILVQQGGGTFAKPVKIGTATKIHGHNGYRYDPWSQSRIHKSDYNRDGRGDLVFWNRDRFYVHLQEDDGLFSPNATTFKTAIPFDSDDPTTLAAPSGVRNRRTDRQPEGKMSGRVLYSLTDMNGDGIGDLVIFSLKGGSVWKMHSTFEIHYGKPIAEGTEFVNNVGATIRSEGILFAMAQHDFDQDGQKDMAFTTIKPGLFKAVGMLVRWVFTRSVLMDLKIHRMDGGKYPAKPNAHRKLKTVSIGGSGEKSQYPAVLIGDVTGDKHLDLLMQNGKKELIVYAGIPGPQLFTSRAQKIKLKMPRSEEYTWLADLNKDGKQDVLTHYVSQKAADRVTILVAK
ncbi:MAG: VCBS repeat-containing protein, partial [Pyrinomonadaceae bacterium]|nr:VCBS repeat-containing protein [Pyrinomonadaceae bacterium]